MVPHYFKVDKRIPIIVKVYFEEISSIAAYTKKFWAHSSLVMEDFPLYPLGDWKRGEKNRIHFEAVT